MKCPKCNNYIEWYKVLRLSRWTSIECSRCHSLYNSKLDIQSIFIFLFTITGVIGAALIASFFIVYWGITSGIIIGIILALLWLVISAYVDAKTVRLAPVEKRQGFKAILGHKYIKKDKHNI